MDTVYFDSMGPSGNIFAVVASCKSKLSKSEYKGLIDKVFNSNSYEEALRCVREYVDLIDLSGAYNER